MPFGERIAAQALALVGTSFRLHGRAVDTGLDCVGLVLLALRRAGWRGPEPPTYYLRGMDARRAGLHFERGGFCRVEMARPGDIVLAQTGPLQLHLMVWARGGLVHAHAGLRRVVLMPRPAPWPLCGIWRASCRANSE